MDSFKSPIFLVKIVEFVVSIICALLIEGIMPSDSMWQVEFIHAAIYGFILINLIVVVTFIFDEALTTRMRVLISGLGVLFHIVTTIILLAYYLGSTTVSRRILAAGLIALVNTIVFAIDCYFTSKYLTE